MIVKKKRNNFLKFFRSLGPKNYYYETCRDTPPFQPSEFGELKMKGICLSVSLQKSVNKTILKAMIERRIEEMEKFYAIYNSVHPDVRKEGLEKAMELFEIQKQCIAKYGLRTYQHRSLPSPQIMHPGIFVANPTIRKFIDIQGGRLVDSMHRAKIIKLSSDKRSKISILKSLKKPFILEFL